LGQQALAGTDLATLFDGAVNAAGRILGVEYCEVLELLPEGDRLIFRACLPGLKDLVDCATVTAGKDSQAGYTLLSRQPVVMQDIEAENRFTPHYLMREHGIVSGMSVVIEGRKRCFGVLDAHTTRKRVFAENDINFLRVVANILAEAIERKKAEESLLKSRQAAERLAAEESAIAEIGRIITSAPDVDDVYQRFAEEVRKVIPFHRIAINLIDLSDGTICAQYFSGLPIPGRRPGGTFPLSGSIAEEVSRTKKTILFSADSEDTVAERFPVAVPLWQAGLRSVLMTPLIKQDRVIGTLSLISRENQGYGGRDILLAENVAAQISGAIANAQLLLERRQAEKALKESESSLKSIFLAAPIGIGVVSNRVLIQVNDRVCEMVGRSREELIGKSARVLYPTDKEFEYVGREKYAQIREHGTGTVETLWQHKDGAIIDVLLSSTAMDPADGSSGVTFTALDITERKRSELTRMDLEEKLRQAQKMEAIGTLAGGIAHDFNNILSAIIGFAELAKIEAVGTMNVNSSINEVLRASFRARDLVRQILTFSRQAETEFGPIQIHLIAKEALKMLRASLPSTIQLRSNISSRGMVMADPTQIHQVVMNLCTNAYHAMRNQGGLLEVAISETRIGLPPEPDLKPLRPGLYLKLSVRDTGQGIDPAIIHRIFDPYFTTKETGKGTGLGLAVVHGIVKSHGGAIQVSSRLGEGTRFDIYFPMIEAAKGVSGTEKEEETARGREKILFVDDEPAIEELGRRLIGSLGYTVSTCADAAEALEIFQNSSQDFDLVITDMTMPHMTGDRLAAELMRIRPGIPVIVCTGFSEQINKEKAQAQGIKAFIMKPFLKREIATAIRDVLDHYAGSHSRPASARNDVR
jgi:PAS domain S-box-containing protein